MLLVTIVECAGVFILQVLGIALNCSIIWHEWNSPEVKRTLINRLNSNNCRISITFNLIALNIIMAIVVRTGVPVLACESAVTTMHALMMCYLANVIISTALRYLYVFGKIGMLNDDFLYAFASVSTALLSAYFTGLMVFTGLYRDPLWVKCVTCPGPREGAVGNLPYAHKFLGSVAVIMHVLFSLRIWWHKKKTSLTIGAQELVQSTSTGMGMAIAKESFVDLSTSLGMLAILVVGATLVAVAKRKYGNDVNSCVPNVMLFICTVEFVIVKAVYYCKNADMRKRVLAMYLGR